MQETETDRIIAMLVASHRETAAEIKSLNIRLAKLEADSSFDEHVEQALDIVAERDTQDA